MLPPPTLTLPPSRFNTLVGEPVVITPPTESEPPCSVYVPLAPGPPSSISAATLTLPLDWVYAPLVPGVLPRARFVTEIECPAPRYSVPPSMFSVPLPGPVVMSPPTV